MVPERLNVYTFGRNKPMNSILKRLYVDVKILEISSLSCVIIKWLMFFSQWQPVISWLSVWPPCSARPTVLQWVRSSPSATLWRFLTSRPAGNTRLWTTRTVSTSTCTQITPPSAAPCSTSCSSTNGKQWRWCTRTQQVGRLVYCSEISHSLHRNVAFSDITQVWTLTCMLLLKK